MGGKSGRAPVYSITGAQRSLSDDLDSRTRRYLIAMGIRTVCFVGAVVVQGPLRWVLVAGAVVLPYLSVVFANAGRERIRDTTPTTVLTLDRPRLGPGSPPGPAGGVARETPHSENPVDPDTQT
ncbi:MAG: DUF3099 domain-containing protein [Actinomycetia bacterium]|jgi:hypothetical protein|nr:DUF3099 domain-containing protein [Actinomycetes bacterium]